MAEFEDRGIQCDCGLREANTALRQRVAELESTREQVLYKFEVCVRLHRRIVEQKREIERLRAERDALIDLCIHEVPPEDPRHPRYTHWSYEGASTEEGDELTEWESLWVARDSRAEAMAAVRRAAGLDAEPDAGEGR